MTSPLKATVVQAHALRCFSNASLNRDANGREKTCRVGGTLRHRWSSQAQKFRLRKTLETELADLPPTLRSRYLFEEEVLKPLMEEEGLDPRYVPHAVGALAYMAVKGRKAMRQRVRKMCRKIEEAQDEALKTEGNLDATVIPPPLRMDFRRILTFGKPELDYILKWSRHLAKRGTNRDSHLALYETALKLTNKKGFASNFEAMGGGLSAALCGRPQGGDANARIESALSVSHAFTTHTVQPTVDYFTQVDDFDEGTISGSHALTSGVYYQHLTLDLRTLWDNLQDAEAASRCSSKAVDVFSRLGTSFPGFSAPYGRPFLYLVELVEPKDAYNFADAFETPSGPSSQAALDQLSQHIKKVSNNWGRVLHKGWAIAGCGHDLAELGYLSADLPSILNELSQEVASCVARFSA